MREIFTAENRKKSLMRCPRKKPGWITLFRSWPESFICHIICATLYRKIIDLLFFS